MRLILTLSMVLTTWLAPRGVWAQGNVAVQPSTEVIKTIRLTPSVWRALLTNLRSGAGTAALALSFVKGSKIDLEEVYEEELIEFKRRLFISVAVHRYGVHRTSSADQDSEPYSYGIFSIKYIRGLIEELKKLCDDSDLRGLVDFKEVSEECRWLITPRDGSELTFKGLTPEEELHRFHVLLHRKDHDPFLRPRSDEFYDALNSAERKQFFGNLREDWSDVMKDRLIPLIPGYQPDNEDLEGEALIKWLRLQEALERESRKTNSSQWNSGRASNFSNRKLDHLSVKDRKDPQSHTPTERLLADSSLVDIEKLYPGEVLRNPDANMLSASPDNSAQERFWEAVDNGHFKKVKGYPIELEENSFKAPIDIYFIEYEGWHWEYFLHQLGRVMPLKLDEEEIFKLENNGLIRIYKGLQGDTYVDSSRLSSDPKAQEVINDYFAFLNHFFSDPVENYKGVHFGTNAENIKTYDFVSELEKFLEVDSKNEHFRKVYDLIMRQLASYTLNPNITGKFGDNLVVLWTPVTNLMVTRSSEGEVRIIDPTKTEIDWPKTKGLEVKEKEWKPQDFTMGKHNPK